MLTCFLGGDVFANILLIFLAEHQSRTDRINAIHQHGLLLSFHFPGLHLPGVKGSPQGDFSVYFCDLPDDRNLRPHSPPPTLDVDGDGAECPKLRCQFPLFLLKTRDLGQARFVAFQHRQSVF